MEFNLSDNRNAIGFGKLMIPDGDNFNTLDLENEIINGDLLITEEEENNANQYKQDMERLTSAYDISDFTKTTYDTDDIKLGGNDPIRNISDFNLDDEINNDEQLRSMTREQQKQSYVDDVLQNIDPMDENLEFDIEKERDEDDKNNLLEQIDMLRDTLEDDGIKLTNVPAVTKSNSISDIKNIYKILQLKNDRNRYCSFAEEMILGGAYGMEYLFDGEKDWFGRTPNLTGWSSTVRIKLRRCRFQTSSIIKDIMSAYNMGPGMQILLELIPSLFLYSRQKKIADAEHADDSQYNDAISNLNNYNQ